MPISISEVNNSKCDRFELERGRIAMVWHLVLGAYSVKPKSMKNDNKVTTVAQYNNSIYFDNNQNAMTEKQQIEPNNVLTSTIATLLSCSSSLCLFLSGGKELAGWKMYGSNVIDLIYMLPVSTKQF